MYVHIMHNSENNRILSVLVSMYVLPKCHTLQLPSTFNVNRSIFHIVLKILDLKQLSVVFALQTNCCRNPTTADTTTCPKRANRFAAFFYWLINIGGN